MHWGQGTFELVFEHVSISYHMLQIIIDLYYNNVRFDVICCLLISNYWFPLYHRRFKDFVVVINVHPRRNDFNRPNYFCIQNYIILKKTLNDFELYNTLKSSACKLEYTSMIITCIKKACRSQHTQWIQFEIIFFSQRDFFVLVVLDCICIQQKFIF